MVTAGLRELQQHASEFVRQAEAGAVIPVSVSGRVVAELGPAHPHRWWRWTDVAALCDGPDESGAQALPPDSRTSSRSSS